MDEQLHIAIYNGDEEGIYRLLESGADPNHTGRFIYNGQSLNGAPPLYEVSFSFDGDSRIRILEELFRYGADVNLNPINGQPPSNAIGVSGDVAYLFAQHHADPNIQDRVDGNTSLHIFITMLMGSYTRLGRLLPVYMNIYEYLRWMGANPNIHNDSGMTMYDIITNTIPLNQGVVPYDINAQNDIMANIRNIDNQYAAMRANVGNLTKQSRL